MLLANRRSIVPWGFEWRSNLHVGFIWSDEHITWSLLQRNVRSHAVATMPSQEHTTHPIGLPGRLCCEHQRPLCLRKSSASHPVIVLLPAPLKCGLHPRARCACAKAISTLLCCNQPLWRISLRRRDALSQTAEPAGSDMLTRYTRFHTKL